MSKNCGFGGRTYCLLCSIYSSIVSIILFLCITWMIILPKELKFTITDAWLREFELSQANNNTLAYNLALNITVQNPNKRVGVYFDQVQVMAKYRKKRFAIATLTSSTPLLYRGRMNITLHSLLKGRETMRFSQRDERQYNSETSSRVYNIDVKIYVVVRTKFGKIKSGPFKPPKIDCDKLKVPLRSSTHGTSDDHENFRARECRNVFILFSPEIDDDLAL